MSSSFSSRVTWEIVGKHLPLIHQMDPLVTEVEELVKQEFFMFLTARILSNTGGIHDFYMNQFVEICDLDLKGEKYELKRLMLDS